MIDYYEILEVSPNVSQEVLKKAYHALVQKYHPDQFHSSNKKYAHHKAQLINDAYRILSDPASRRRYDYKLAEKTRIEPKKQTPMLKSLLTGIAVGIVLLIGFRFMGVIIEAAFGFGLLKIVIPLLLVFFLFRYARTKKNPLIKR